MLILFGLRELILSDNVSYLRGWMYCYFALDYFALNALYDTFI
jgi:hypothetical protein